MNAKKASRIRRARRGRELMKRNASWRLSVFRSGRHLYAQVISVTGGSIAACASTLESAIRDGGGSRMDIARRVGEFVARRAKEKELQQVAFDRSGYRYHGRIKALAEGARAEGLEF